MKALDPSVNGFCYLQQKFSNKSFAKTKAGVFVGPDIQKLICDETFCKNLNTKEKAAWYQFCMVVKKILGSCKPPNLVKIVTDFFYAHQKLGARMSLKIYFLHLHLDFFPSNIPVTLHNNFNHNDLVYSRLK